jgi:hypothetical protein
VVSGSPCNWCGIWVGLLKCVEGPHFVVWGGNGAPRTQLELLFL